LNLIGSGRVSKFEGRDECVAGPNPNSIGLIDDCQTSLHGPRSQWWIGANLRSYGKLRHVGEQLFEAWQRAQCIEIGISLHRRIVRKAQTDCLGEAFERRVVFILACERRTEIVVMHRPAWILLNKLA